MSLPNLLFYVLVAVVGTFVISACIRAVWFAVGAYRINRAGPRPLSSAIHLLWKDPGDVSSLDVVDGPGGPDGA